MGVTVSPYKSARLGEMPEGAIACWQSHLRMWLDILDKRYGTALIFEDDIDVDVDIKTIMADVHESMKGLEWDLLYLGTCEMHPGRRVSTTEPTTPRPFSTPRT
jgi:GR25 family glycosyltransferase involved in LPS biosynthesis